MFTTAQGKHEHIKYVKCKPPNDYQSVANSFNKKKYRKRILVKKMK